MAPDLENKLKKFSHFANKSTLGSHPDDRERWFDFIISVHKEGGPVDYQELQKLLLADGWLEDAVVRLAVMCEDGIGLLAKYDRDR